MKKRMLLALTIMTVAALGSFGVFAQNQMMSFFVTSAGMGNGANLGGVAGADKHCQTLAAAVGAGNRTWRAYLSTSGTGAQKPVNARDRIGKGPWFNVKGVQVAANLDELHSDKNNITKQTALTEKGAVVNGVGDTPNQHDMLTGSALDGRLMMAEGGGDATCGNWTASGDGSAQVGHSDRMGRGAGVSPWNSAHPSRGCSQPNLVATGGAGMFYCFAAN